MGHKSLTALVTFEVTFSLLLLGAIPGRADDWTQWRGSNRDGIWRETGILEAIPPAGLKVRWRARIGQGYSGPVVAQGRVYVSDRWLKPEAERVLCFEEATGRPLWTRAFPISYGDLAFGNGPRASPTVRDGKVYTLGSKGHLVCLDAASGDVVWQKDLVKEYKAAPPMYGVSPAPLVEGELLIACAGAKPDASVIAFDRTTGEERWKALPDRPAYSAPLVINAGGCRQLIVWTADFVNSLEPSTGKLYWQIPYKTTFDEAQVVASPVQHKDRLLCLAGWYRGSFMLKLDADKPEASVVWKTPREPTTMISTPIFQDDAHFYHLDNRGNLCCVEAATGKEVWKSDQPAGRDGSNAHMTPNGDRVFLFNQKGQLVLARLTPEGYLELGRCLLVEPTAGYRAGGAVAWAHPAYANRSVYARNDRELVCASLAAGDVAELPPEQPQPESRVLAGFKGSNTALSLAFSPDGHLALGTWQGEVKLMDVTADKEPPPLVKHDFWVHSVAFAPTRKLLVSAGGNDYQKMAELKVWDFATGAERGQLVGHEDKVRTVAFSPDSATLASGASDGTVRLWDMATMKERTVLRGHSDAVFGVAFSPDGRTVASASADKTVKLWDAGSGEEQATLKGHEDEVFCLGFSPDGKSLATGGADWMVRLWNLERRVEQAVLKGHQGSVSTLAFAADGTLASGSGDQTIKLWDMTTLNERITLRGHQGGITALSWSPNNKTLASAAIDDAVRLWKLNR